MPAPGRCPGCMPTRARRTCRRGPVPTSAVLPRQTSALSARGTYLDHLCGQAPAVNTCRRRNARFGGDSPAAVGAGSHASGMTSIRWLAIASLLGTAGPTPGGVEKVASVGGRRRFCSSLASILGRRDGAFTPPAAQPGGICVNAGCQKSMNGRWAAWKLYWFQLRPVRRPVCRYGSTHARGSPRSGRRPLFRWDCLPGWWRQRWRLLPISG